MEYGVLDTHDKLLEVIINYDFLICHKTPSFLQVYRHSEGVATTQEEAANYVSSDLLEEFEYLIEKHDADIHRLYGYDNSNHEYLLLERQY